MLSFFWLMTGSFTNTGYATIIPAGTFTETTISSSTLGGEPVINCDMQVGGSGGIVKAIVWGAGEPIGPVTAPAQIYSEDWAGNTSLLNLPSGSQQPDVALAVYLSNPLNPASVVYQMLVTYTVGNTLYFSIYNLQNLGLSSFSINSTAAYSNTLSTTCNGFPHIDMWMDNYSSTTYAGAMHKFAVVWSEGASQTLKCYSADAQFPSSSPFTLGSGSGATNCRMPDVACFTDLGTSSSTFGDDFVEVTYGVASSTTAQTTALKTDEFDASASWGRSSGYPVTNFSGTPITGSQHGVVYAPRIEAACLYNNDGESVKYQIAADVQLGTSFTHGPYEVWGFNEAYPSGYTLSASQFTQPNDLCMSACVCVGYIASNTGALSAIGVNQYTVGFSGNPDIFSRGIQASGSATVLRGKLITPSSWFQVNNTSPAINVSQISKAFAISNCTNTGDDILTVWTDGSSIVYKHSTPNVMQFRVAHRTISTEVVLYPNPTVESVRLQGVEGDARYAILNMNGKVVLSGTLEQGGIIPVTQLPVGTYMLRGVGISGGFFTRRFIKQ